MGAGKLTVVLVALLAASTHAYSRNMLTSSDCHKFIDDCYTNVCRPDQDLLVAVNLVLGLFGDFEPSCGSLPSPCSSVCSGCGSSASCRRCSGVLAYAAPNAGSMCKPDNDDENLCLAVVAAVGNKCGLLEADLIAALGHCGELSKCSKPREAAIILAVALRLGVLEHDLDNLVAYILAIIDNDVACDCGYKSCTKNGPSSPGVFTNCHHCHDRQCEDCLLNLCLDVDGLVQLHAGVCGLDAVEDTLEGALALIGGLVEGVGDMLGGLGLGLGR